MPYKMKERFLFYPLAFMVLFFLLFTKYADTGITHFLDNLIVVFYSTFISEFGLSIGKEIFAVLYGYIVGYIYGTFSIVLKIRNMKGLAQIVFGIVKVLASVFFVVYGIFILPLELIFLPIGIMIKRQYKKHKKSVRDKELMELMKRSIREESQKNDSLLKANAY